MVRDYLSDLNWGLVPRLDLLVPGVLYCAES